MGSRAPGRMDSGRRRGAASCRKLFADVLEFGLNRRADLFQVVSMSA
ncbi:MAG: hypothetical protein RB296_09080 [Acidobacteriota bacterium]|jgi:hypothetical protein|nr:hypothetical protein [Acidobacteriota bacterium]